MNNYEAPKAEVINFDKDYVLAALTVESRHSGGSN